ncbi:MAG TPA: M20 family metallopeptidase [Candidatus Saccharimonadales bacterium]|nr:M20 family metallopeptidase [Candidatus Saccharimonadales bacterium]
MLKQTEAEQLLSVLVGMPTLSSDVVANDIALEYIEHYLVERGMFIKRFQFDGHSALVASTRRNNDKKPAVLLAAHVDVMTGSEQVFTMRQEDGKLKGRGVYDMKFAIAGYMQLVDDLKGNLSDYDFAIMVTTDEELGATSALNGTGNLVKAGYLPKVCILPDSAAPGWNIEKLCKGHWRFDLIANGRTAHSSRPWEGDSASFKLVQALHDIKAEFKDHGPTTDTLNIGIIHGGETYNQIPSLMTAAVEIRFLHRESYDKHIRMVKGICQLHDVSYKDYSAKMPIKTDLDHPLVKSFMDSIEAVTGIRPEGSISYGGTDASYFVEHGIPCIVSCPEGGGHHSENEWITRESFLHYVPILRHYIEKTARIKS